MKVLLHGCNGKMGQVLTRLISEDNVLEVSYGVDLAPDRIKNPYPVYSSLKDVREKVDIVIDFSNHACLDSLLEFGLAAKVPLVICTTGFSPDEKARMKEASSTIPILNSANMSLGVNLVLSLARQAAKVLYENYDIEIIEKHHNQKVDSPSGTALMIADEINAGIDNALEYTYGRHSKTQKRDKKELGIHAVRGGAIVGEHDIIFAGLGEVIEINHSAISRDVFGYGALSAAKFLADKKPGLYSMKDVIG